MKKLLYKFIIISLLCILPITGIRFWYISTQDHYYDKFTHQAPSLVIGASISRYSTNPVVIEQILEDKYQFPMLNYGFSFGLSSYDRNYIEAIKNKIPKDTKNGLFIIETSPPLFRSVVTKHPLYELNFHNLNPNFEYIIKYPTSKQPFYRSLVSYFESLHTENKTAKSPMTSFTTATPQGWSALNAPDSICEKRKGMESYPNIKPLSKEQCRDFEELIAFLQNHGEIFFVNIPIDPSLWHTQVKNSYQETEQFIQQLLKRHPKTHYLNLYSDSTVYSSFDGLHMTAEGANNYTKALAQEIKRLKFEGK